MSTGFHVKTLTLSLRNLTSALSYLSVRFAAIQVVLEESPRISSISFRSLDLVAFLEVPMSRISVSCTASRFACS